MIFELTRCDCQAFHFDIASPFIHNFPPRWAAGYLNNATVQADLGVPLNFTGFSAVVAQEFEASGDFMKGDGLAILGQMLDRGVKVSLLYGDRDYQCNCELSPLDTCLGTTNFKLQGSAVKLLVSPSTPASRQRLETQDTPSWQQTLRTLVD
jgi:hypothetical protein